MDYLHKFSDNPYEDLYWNIAEQTKSVVNVIGGNSQNFRTSVKVSEYLAKEFPVDVKMVLPDALKNKLPPLDNIIYMESTDSGSFADTDKFKELVESADYNLMIGDFSKNSITEKAIKNACLKGKIIITRDAVDALSNSAPDKDLMNENLIIFGSMAQLQKLFRAVYYPKVLLLTQSLMQVAENLHKFTLSYPVSIITLHDNQIIIAKNGNINVLPLEKTDYSPMTIWSGECAAKLTAMNLFNPDNFLNASVAAMFKKSS